MTDGIELTGLTVTTPHGVLEHEKVQPQPFIVDVHIECDLRGAGDSDDLARTISYAEVAQEVEQILHQAPVDLIETLAEQIATAVLRRPAAEAVQVVVHKPDAPAGVQFSGPHGGPSVTVRRAQRRPVTIALGANLGDRATTLQRAVRALDRLPGLEVSCVSRLFETDPVGGPDQPDYLNAVVTGFSRLAPWTLLAALHRIEADHRRVREERWGARTLDLDLIQVGDPDDDSDLRSDEDALRLPHPRAHERAFVLAPWLDADPNASLRVGDSVRTVADLVEQTSDEGLRTGPEWSMW